MAHTEEQLAVNSIIGEGAEFSGDFKLSGLLRIDGIFRGTIKTDGKVLIGKTGIVDTDIKARIVVAGGEMTDVQLQGLEFMAGQLKAGGNTGEQSRIAGAEHRV